MKRTLSALLVSSALLCAAVLPTMAAESAAPAQTDSAAVQEETMSDSELYYGQVQEIGRDEAGTITSLLLTSERYGEYVMNISGETVWIDSGERTASDPATLQVGESVYVYHSPVSTRSLPPQSPRVRLRVPQPGLHPLPAPPVPRLRGGAQCSPGCGRSQVPGGGGCHSE